MEQVWNLIAEVRVWVDRHMIELIAAGLFSTLIAVSVPRSTIEWFVRRKKKQEEWVGFIPRSYRRRGRMLRKAREDFVFNLVTQDFVDSVEMRVYHQEITRSEAIEIYRRLKNRFPIRSLFPSAELLKEKIKNRLGKHVTPNFPDKKPVKKLKRMIEVPPERVVL